ncbi:MAG: hypothetical protein Q4C70_02070 [Planctomycetia bacterium]|nr:hypothetical protein [Planctomycetia bacterium]
MDHIIPIGICLFALVLLVFIGAWLIMRYRQDIQDNTAPGEQAVHSMLTELQNSYDRGDISTEEFRVIKAELTARLRDLHK